MVQKNKVLIFSFSRDVITNPAYADPLWYSFRHYFHNGFSIHNCKNHIAFRQSSFEPYTALPYWLARLGGTDWRSDWLVPQKKNHENGLSRTDSNSICEKCIVRWSLVEDIVAPHLFPSLPHSSLHHTIFDIVNFALICQKCFILTTKLYPRDLKENWTLYNIRNCIILMKRKKLAESYIVHHRRLWWAERRLRFFGNSEETLWNNEVGIPQVL